MAAILQWLKDFAAWLYDILMFIPRVLADLLWDAIAALVEAIPAFSWLQGDIWAGLPDGVAWFLTEFQFPLGITIVLSALTTRFLVRRLPFVG